MKRKYAKKDSIPEGLGEFYKEVGGEWVLQVDGMVDADELSVLRNKVDEFRTNNTDLNDKLKKFDGKKMLSAEETEEFARLVQQATDIDDKKLIDAGKIDELLENKTNAMREDYEAKLTSMRDTVEKSNTSALINAKRLSSVMIRSEVGQMLSDNGYMAVQGAMDDIYGRAGQMWSVNDEGALHALNGKGQPVYGTGTDPLTLKEWGAKLVKDAPFLFVPNEGSRAPGSRQQQQGGSDGILRIPRGDEVLKSKHIDDIASGKAVVVD